MAIAVQSTGAQIEQASGGTTMAVPYPATLDSSSTLLLVCAGTGATRFSSLGSGWVDIARILGTGDTVAPTLYVARKQASGSETGSLTVTKGSGFATIGQMTAFSGVDLTTPEDVAAQIKDQTTALANTTFTGLTIVTTGAALIYGIATNSASAAATPPTSPGTFTETMDHSSGSAAGTAGYLLGVSSGSTSTVAVTWSGSPKSVGYLVALRPAATATNAGQFFAMF